MIFNKTIDLFFIRFPIIFQILYLFILFSFPEQEKILSLIVLLLFAEPHFGATWTMFMDKKMLFHAKSKKYSFIFGSLAIILSSILIFLINKTMFYILFFSYNIYHVTKQSIGICRFYTKNNHEAALQNNLLWIFNILIIIFGAFLYLSLGLISKDTANFIGNFFIISSIVSVIFQTLKYKSINNSLTTLTGLLIFIPSFYVSKPIHALLAGVTMHYSQYIAFTLKLYLSKKKIQFRGEEKNDPKSPIKGYLLWIFSYGFIATSLTFIGGIKEVYSNLLFIPILGQIIHFYLDGLIWKFKDQKLKEINLKYLFY